MEWETDETSEHDENRLDTSGPLEREGAGVQRRLQKTGL